MHPPSETTAALDQLLARGPLSVAFQPIVDLARGRPLGYEVLGRCGPVEGPLADAAKSPAVLLEVAEKHGRLLALDRRWRELAIRTIAERGDADWLFFLNVDPRVVEDPAYTPGYTLSLVRRHGLAPARFVLELTEAPSRDPKEVERVLAHYSRQGFKVALDDLGAGQQSLVTLLRVAPDIVKLDRDLVRSVDTDSARTHLLRALSEFARRTGILLVAEGIETPGELQAVCDAGVPLGQGFLLGRPAPAPEPLSTSVRALLGSTHRRAGHESGRTRTDRDPSFALASLVDGLRAAPALDAMLPLVTDCAAALLGAERVSLRLLDEARARLLVAARTGPSLHGGGGADFAVGEGFAGWVAEHGVALRVGRADDDPRFVTKPGMRSAIGSFLGVPLLDAGGVIGVLATTSPEPDAFSLADERWMRVVAGTAAPYLDVARLSRLAITDPLTSALNRRALEGLLPHAEAERVAPLCAVAVDLDRFKSINDRFGHGTGDLALRAVVRLMTSVLRQSDRIVRLGGEEFLLVLPGVDRAGAQAIAERVRAAIAAADILPDARLTVSAGVAEQAPGEDRDSLLARADRALYQAKSKGRDRVELGD
jgi:diguanylate cyclase (GGDEF)-like protein